MPIDSFRTFTGRPDRSRHLAWSPGDVEIEPPRDDEKGDETRIDPRRRHLAWGIQDVQFRRRIDEDYDVVAKRVEPISQEELDHHAEHRKTYDDQMKRSHAFYKMSSHHFNDQLRNQENHSSEGHVSIKDYDYRAGSPNRRSKGLVNEKDGHKIEHFHALDRITGKPTKTDMHVYRGFSNFPVHEMKPGTEFIDHGYTGTSRDVRTATSFSHLTGGPKPMDHIARIHVPAGTKAHYLDHPTAEQPSESMHSRENEILLHRGTRFRVMGHSEIDGETARNFVGGHSGSALPMRIVHLKVVGQDPKPLRKAEEQV